jgi:hypothetical protein
VVLGHNHCKADRSAGMDPGPVSNAVIQDAGLGRRGRFMSSWLGKVGEQADIQTHKWQKA